jgi:acetyl-CoA carboxylase biotin carboxyl carrier protein
MAGPSSNPGEVFDLRKIRRLAELMNEHDLSEIALQQADFRIRLRRGNGQVVASGPTPIQVTTASPPSAQAVASADVQHISQVTSPMVGTFYASSSPDLPPFIKVGDHVGPDTTVCIVEAMKVFNEIPAGISGRVIAVLAENGEPVEFGQPLYKIDTRG